MIHTIEKINIKDTKTTERGGKVFNYTPVGLRINGTWHNALITKDDQLNVLKELNIGEDIDLILFEGEYTDKNTGDTKISKNFKFPTKVDKLEVRLNELTSRFNNMAKYITGKFPDDF